MKLFEDFTNLMQLKHYSYSTINSYRNALKKFFDFYPDTEPEYLNKKDVEYFINISVTEHKISQSYQKQLVGALRLFYNDLLRKNYDLYYLYPSRRERKIPDILSKSEVQKLLNSLDNIKHRTILATIYSGGLRLEEVLNLKINDIDSENMFFKIKNAKGNKDRNVLLSEKLLKLLREYYLIYKPTEHVFEGQKGGKYSTSSVQIIMKRAAKLARIKKEQHHIP